MENNKEKSFLVDMTGQHQKGEGVEVLSTKMPEKINVKEYKKTKIGFIKRIFINESHWIWSLLTLIVIAYFIYMSMKSNP